MRLLIAICTLAWASVTSAEAEFLVSQQTRDAGLPFSDATRVGNILFLSGQMGFPPGSPDLVEGGLRAEAHQIFANIKRILDANGSSLDRVFKCTVMLDDISKWAEFNEVYVSYFPSNKPSRSAFGADGLANGGAAEVECWATVD